METKHLYTTHAFIPNLTLCSKQNNLISTFPILLAYFNHTSYLFMSISSLSGTSTALNLLYREPFTKYFKLFLVALDLTTVKGVAIAA